MSAAVITVWCNLCQESSYDLPAETITGEIAWPADPGTPCAAEGGHAVDIDHAYRHTPWCTTCARPLGECEHDRPMSETIALSVCQCCLAVMANGECCEQHNDRNGQAYAVEIHPDARWYASADTVTVPANLALWEGKPYDVVPGNDDLGFRTSPCDGCGSTDHGDRYSAYALPI